MSARRTSLQAVEHRKGVHAGLWLDKYITSHARIERSRHDLVQQVAATNEPECYKSYFARWQESLEAHGAQFCEARVFGRMVVGLGEESVLETSVTLHHTYGVPYIPGSALKGLAASYAHQYLGDAWRSNSPAFNAVFGTQETAGYITFFDALYVPGSGARGHALHPDVLTVHHMDYYQNKAGAAPADWDDPNPVPFISATGKYLIALGTTQGCEGWIESAFSILKNALKSEGIGAKTSSGYGRMEFDTPPPDPDQLAADELIQHIKAIPANKLASELGQQASKLLGLQIGARHQRRVVQAIMSRTTEAGRKQEKQFADKLWYAGLQNILSTK
jgi:CRISPR-associated protein Cmr6